MSFWWCFVFVWLVPSTHRISFENPSLHLSVVGGLTTALNFVEHKNASLTIPALVGLLFIYLANHHASHTNDGAFLRWVQVHTGTAHRLTSILGCSMLLLSNFRAQRLKGACRDKKCKHNILWKERFRSSIDVVRHEYSSMFVKCNVTASNVVSVGKIITSKPIIRLKSEWVVSLWY